MAIRNRPQLTRKHAEEISKLVASGLQNLALLLFGAILVQPLINPALAPSKVLLILSLSASAVAEVSALLLLRYIPFTPDPKDTVP